MEIILLITTIALALILALILARQIFKAKRDIKNPLPKVSNEKRVSGNSARREYTFQNGVHCYQEELTYDQDKKVVSLIAELDVKDFKNIKVNDIVEVLSKQNALEKFFMIILQPVNSVIFDESIFGTLRTSEVDVIIEDFFTLNPTAIKLYGIFKTTAVLAGIEELTSGLETTKQTSSDANLQKNPLENSEAKS